ncbi:MAG: glycosyltransferase [Pseudomonadota bacterium]
MNVFAVIAVVGLSSYTFAVIALVLLRMKGKNPPSPGERPRVSILKPLKGMDDGLRENLESFFTLDYPDYEIIFGADDADDPAILAAKSLMAGHPDREVKLSIGSSASGTNPKVRNLVSMLGMAAGDFIVVSDSNTRVNRDYLEASMGYFSDPDVALVSHFLSGEGERSAGAILEHLHICGFIVPAQSFAMVIAGITPIIGKSMIIRRSHLEEVGSIGGLSDYLAEDYLLGRKLAKAGRKVVISTKTVTNFNSNTTIRTFFQRHYRWLSMRWRINPFSCFVELLTIPALWSSLWLITGDGSAAWPLAVYGVHLLVQQLAVTIARSGKPLPATSLVLSPLKDVLHVLIMLASLVGNRVEWRGNHYRIGWKSKLTPIKARKKRRSGSSLISARLGDPGPAEKMKLKP